MTRRGDLDSLRRRPPETIEQCRAKPDKRFADMLQPAGAYIDTLAKGVR